MVMGVRIFLCIDPAKFGMGMSPLIGNMIIGGVPLHDTLRLGGWKRFVIRLPIMADK